MKRRTVSSGSPLDKKIGVAKAVSMGSHIYVSGTGPCGTDGVTKYPGDVYRQCGVCLSTIKSAIDACGGDIRNVVRTRIYLKDITRWGDASRAHGEFFADIMPASTIVEVKGFIKDDWTVMIECDCMLTDDKKE